MKTKKLQENLQKEFPEFNITITDSEGIGSKKIIEISIYLEGQFEIIYHQIKNHFDNEENSIELLEAALIKITQSNLNIYHSEDKKQILKDSKTIVKMVDAEAVSFHKLKENELQDKMKLYELKEKDFAKEEK